MVEADDDDGNDGGDVSDEDEALDIDPHDIEHAKERGKCYYSQLEHFIIKTSVL